MSVLNDINCFSLLKDILRRNNILFYFMYLLISYIYLCVFFFIYIEWVHLIVLSFVFVVRKNILFI